MLYVAQSKSEMTDINKYYVYVGSETDMSNGFWYFWDGERWSIGGEYNGGVDEIIDPAIEALFAEVNARIDMIQRTGLIVEGTTITPVQSSGTRFNLVINNN